MKINTLVEVKCQCAIPFHSDLLDYLKRELGQPLQDNAPIPEIPHGVAILNALQSRMLFIKVAHPLKKLKPKLVDRLQKIFKKNFVGTIKAHHGEITLILV